MASSVLNGIGLAGYWLIGYRGIHEKGSGDVVAAVCYTVYTIYLSLCTTSPEPFS